MRDEFAELPTGLRQGAALTSHGDRPLAVVTAVAEAEDGWLPLQDEMLTLATNSFHMVLPDATHDSLITDEDDAVLASQAIRDVVESVRTGKPLANPFWFGMPRLQHRSCATAERVRAFPNGRAEAVSSE